MEWRAANTTDMNLIPINHRDTVVQGDRCYLTSNNTWYILGSDARTWLPDQQGKEADSYPLCNYVVKNTATWNPASFTAADLDGCSSVSIGDRILCPSGAYAGVWVATSATAATADTSFVAVEGYTVHCVRSAGAPTYRQTATNNATTAAFEIQRFTQDVVLPGRTQASLPESQVTPWDYGQRVIAWYNGSDLYVSGATAAWPEHRAGGTATTQATSGYRPSVELATANHLTRMLFTKSSTQNLAVSHLATLLAGSAGFADFTLVCRCRQQSYGDNCLMAVVDPNYGNYQLTTSGNPGYRMHNPYLSNLSALDLNSPNTDKSQTSDMVAYISSSGTGYYRIFAKGILTSSEHLTTPAVAANPSAVYIGGVAAANTWDGWVQEWILFRGELSEAEIRALQPYLFREQTVQLIAVGNSIFYGYSGQTPLLSCIEDNLPQRIGVTCGLGAPSQTTDYLYNLLDSKVAPQLWKRSAMLFWEGTNQINAANGNATLAQVIASHQAVKAWCDAKNILLFGGTVLPRSSITGTQETVRTGWNAELLANAPKYTSGYGFVIDWASLAHAADPANLTYYIDGTHPATALAQDMGVLAGEVIPGVIA